MFNRTITAGLLAAAAAITPLRADVSQNLVDLRNSDYLSGTHIILCQRFRYDRQSHAADLRRGRLPSREHGPRHSRIGDPGQRRLPLGRTQAIKRSTKK